MNLQLVPKYTKYNNCLKQVYFTTLPSGRYRQSQTLNEDLPYVVVEKPKRLPVPITVTRYKEKSPKRFRRRNWNPIKDSPKDVTNNKTTQKTWSLRRLTKSKDIAKKPNKICKWYTKRKALQELKLERKKENKRLKEYDKLRKIEDKKTRDELLAIARREREAEFVDHLRKQEKEQAKIEKETLDRIEKNKKEKVEKTSPKFDKKKDKHEKRSPKFERKKITKVEKTYEVSLKKDKLTPAGDTSVQEPVSPPKKKKTTVKETTVIVKQPDTKYKKPPRSRRDSLSNRFVNCFYRLCCQFYCWVTIVLIIGMVIFFVL